MKHLLILIACLTGINASVQAQRFTISGTIKDAATGENLIGASVYDQKTMQGSSANTYGFYSLSLKSDSIVLTFSYVGYKSKAFSFLLNKDTVINVQLAASDLLDEIIVRADLAEKIHEVTKMSSIAVPIQQIKEMPALLGEVDVLKVLQLLPGVQSGTEGGSGMYVRGGGPDQNLILLDGVPVYNAAHLFGFFSVFNADAINQVELIKGGFPARYGGRLSSVIDINMKEGNMKEVKGEGSIGIIASKLTVEGPIKKDRTSFIISGRRTYIDLLAMPIMKAALDGERAGYYFYDLNAKINHIVNDKNRIYLSMYSGDDRAYSKYDDYYTYDNVRTEYKDEYGLSWGNLITALRWNQIISPKFFGNYTFTYSKYRFNIFSEYETTEIRPGNTTNEYFKEQYISGIRDWAIKADFDFIPNPNHYIKFGGNTIWHTFSPGVFRSQSKTQQDTTFGATNLQALEYAFYVEDDYKVSRNLKVNYGLHFSGFNIEDRNYTSLQPRISARYLLGKDYSLKASFVTMTQFLHLLTNAGLGLPTDLWVPATAQIEPQRANQWAIGVAKSFDKGFELSVEGYYKTMDGLIEYKDGASYLNIEEDWQSKVVTGEGESYGAEVFLQKKIGKISGWAGYTLSWSNRRFDEINFGEWFPYRYDRRHDISLALSHQWSEKMDFSMVWVYGTGNAVSLPVATYPRINNNDRYSYISGPVDYYEGRNSFRMRAYHRLDLSVSFNKQKKRGIRKWTFGVYNAYSRLNPFFMEIGYDRAGQKKVKQFSLFPIIPSFSYNFKF